MFLLHNAGIYWRNFSSLHVVWLLKRMIASRQINTLLCLTNQGFVNAQYIFLKRPQVISVKPLSKGFITSRHFLAFTSNMQYCTG